MHKFTIAIDGPAAAGKTTNSKAIAERLGIQYIDTGAIYRTIGLATIRAERFFCRLISLILPRSGWIL